MADLWLPAEHDVEVTIRNGKVTVSERMWMTHRPVGKSIGYTRSDSSPFATPVDEADDLPISERSPFGV